MVDVQAVHLGQAYLYTDTLDVSLILQHTPAVPMVRGLDLTNGYNLISTKGSYWVGKGERADPRNRTDGNLDLEGLVQRCPEFIIRSLHSLNLLPWRGLVI